MAVLCKHAAACFKNDVHSQQLGQVHRGCNSSEQQHLFSLFGQLGIDISFAPAQQVGGNQVTQHNSTLVCR